MDATYATINVKPVPSITPSPSSGKYISTVVLVSLLFGGHSRKHKLCYACNFSNHSHHKKLIMTKHGKHSVREIYG